MCKENDWVGRLIEKDLKYKKEKKPIFSKEFFELEGTIPIDPNIKSFSDLADSIYEIGGDNIMNLKGKIVSEFNLLSDPEYRPGITDDDIDDLIDKIMGHVSDSINELRTQLSKSLDGQLIDFLRGEVN